MKSNKGLVVLISGIIFNLSIGVLYAWSIIKSALHDGDLQYEKAQASLPYTVAIVFFAIGLLVGGRIQDKIGPKKVITIGGLLVGLGLVVSSFILSSPIILAITFGVISGTGIGFGYGAVSPACLKWFHPSKKGLISGLVVGAFGFGAVIFAPLTQAILDSNDNDVAKTMLILGIGIAVISFIFAQFITNPPEGYTPKVPENYVPSEKSKNVEGNNYTAKEMVKTPQFYLMFLVLAFGSTVGLMVIGNMKDIFNLLFVEGVTIAGKTLTPEASVAITAATMVALLAVFNTLGRVLAGIISDKIGRVYTLMISATLQTIAMILLPQVGGLTFLILVSIAIGYTYGSYLSVIPSLTADNFGIKNYGGNYGIVYLSWGIAGVIAPIVASNLGINNPLTYYIAAGFSVFVLIVSIGLKVLGPVKPNK